MTVPARLRKFAELKVILTAQKLRNKVVSIMVNDNKVAKKYRPNLSKTAIDYTNEIVSELVEANDYIPDDENKKLCRLMHLNEVLKLILKLELLMNTIKDCIKTITYGDFEKISELLSILRKETQLWQRSTKEKSC
ncbi:MAG: hypothetical protein ACI4V7_06430 [Succinivibrionaceae bacterium]